MPEEIGMAELERKVEEDGKKDDKDGDKKDGGNDDDDDDDSIFGKGSDDDDDDDDKKKAGENVKNKKKEEEEEEKDEIARDAEHEDDEEDGDLLDSLMQDETETEAKDDSGKGDGAPSGPLLLEALAAEQATEAFMRERKLREEKLERLELVMNERAGNKIAPKAKPEVDERTEKYSGLRLRNRIMPADVLERNMAGRTFMKLSQLNETVLADMAKRTRKDWVLIGVLTDKNRTSPDAARMRNMPKSTWTVSDLAARRTFITLSLFDEAHSKHFDRTPIGTVVLLYEPSVRPSRKMNTKLAFYLSASLDTQIMLLGDALDFALCAGTSYDGSYCKEPVNSRLTRFCAKHESAELANIRSSRMMLHSSGGVRVSSQSRSSTTRNLSSVEDDKDEERKARTGTKRKLSTAEQLREARQRKLAAEKLKPKGGGNAIVLADGSISVEHDEDRKAKLKKKKKKTTKDVMPGGMSERANSIVNALNSNIRELGPVSVTQQTTKGLRRAYAAITGADIQAQSRRDNAMHQRELQKAMKDPLKAASLAKSRTKLLAATGGAMASRVNMLSRKGAPTKVAEAAAIAESLDPRLKAKIRASTSSQTLAQQSGRFGVNEDIVRQRREEQRVVDERARQRYESERNAKRDKARANQEKILAVKARLAEQRASAAALAPVNPNSSRLRDLRRVKVTARPPGADPLLGFTSRKAKSQGAGRAHLAAPQLSRSVPPAPAQAAARGRPDVIISLKQGLDASTAQEVLKKKSGFQEAGQHAKSQALQNTLRGLASAEAASDKKSLVTELKIKAVLCHECERTTEEKMPCCQMEDHETTEVEVTKRFFRCAKPDCGERASTLGKKTCRQPCPVCAGIRWVPCSAYSDKTLGIAKRYADNPHKPADNEGPCTTFNRRGG